jgi:hypothetical protein
MREVKAMVIVNGKEPELITIQNDLGAYREEINKHLTEDERAKGICEGLDFFNVGTRDIGGVVDEWSSVKPYARNRDWHGPALIFAYGVEGETVDLNDSQIEELKNKFALSNTPKSKSQFINDFMEKHHKEPEIFNYSYGNIEATLNTSDYAQMVLEENRDEEIGYLEHIFNSMKNESSDTGVPVEEILNKWLKALGENVVRRQAEETPLFAK